MRIRRSASRILGSAHSAPAPAPRALDAVAAPTLDLLPPPPPPPPLPAPCSAAESRGVCDFSSPAATSGELCELNRSPWDLIAELSISDPQVEDDLVDRYFVHVPTRASWLFSATMPSTSAKKKKKLADAAADGGDSTQPQRQALKKAAVVSKWKEGEAKKKAKVNKEVGQLDGGASQVWKCKKNNGKSWHCHRTVTKPNSLCDHHNFLQKRCYSDPDFELPSAAESEETAPVVPVVTSKASKRSTSHKPRKKKKKPGSDFSATEGFYYYAGFGTFRTNKRQFRSGGMNEPLPAEQEEKEEEQPRDASAPIQAEVDDEGLRDDSNRTAGHGNASSCDDDTSAIAGVDEVSSDDFDGLGVSSHAGMNGGDPQASSSGDGKTRTMQWKRWRKPVKARSLMSLM